MKQSIIRKKIKQAFDDVLKDGDITKLVKAVADVADRSVNCAGHAQIMYDAIDAQWHIFLADEYLNRENKTNEEIEDEDS